VNDRGMTPHTVRDPSPNQKLSGRQREPTAL